MTVQGDDSAAFLDVERDNVRQRFLDGWDWEQRDTPSRRNPLHLPLREVRVALISTGGVHPVDRPPLGASGRTYVIPLDAPVMLTHPGYDTALAMRDPETVWPVRTLLSLAAERHIGVAVPTALSCMGGVLKAERIVERAVPEAVEWAVTQRADLVVILPTCPVCNQSAALIQRGLDEAGLSTVSITVLPSVAERVKPSLACFVAHPFGLTMGPVGDAATHAAVLRAVLAEAERDHPAGTIVPLPQFRWPDDLRSRQLQPQSRPEVPAARD